VWRFYTVPGDPKQGFEHPELKMASKTWSPKARYDVGLGGTVWDGMAYDPQLNLLYVGTGNGAPWDRRIRSPGGGDNLFLSCILAINPDTGRMVWYYQVTPADTLDFTATQKLILADLTIGGRERHVIMQAPKNGFFYVLDRQTGELLSAKPYSKMTWATGVDMKTGRPQETEMTDYSKVPRVLLPGPGRRAPVAADVAQPGHRPRLHSGAGNRCGVHAVDCAVRIQEGHARLGREPGAGRTGWHVAGRHFAGRHEAGSAAAATEDVPARVESVEQKLAWEVEMTGDVAPGYFLRRLAVS
jgi:hypothetical protein